VIELQDEHLMTLAEAANLRPSGRNGRPTHVSTVYRWIAGGVRGVRLESIRLGGTLYTSREAVQRFAERLTHGPTNAADAIQPPSMVARRRSAVRAGQELDRLGL
jgi:hypothetical protein